MKLARRRSTGRSRPVDLECLDPSPALVTEPSTYHCAPRKPPFAIECKEIAATREHYG